MGVGVEVRARVGEGRGGEKEKVKGVDCRPWLVGTALWNRQLLHAPPPPSTPSSFLFPHDKRHLSTAKAAELFLFSFPEASIKLQQQFIIGLTVGCCCWCCFWCCCRVIPSEC